MQIARVWKFALRLNLVDVLGGDVTTERRPRSFLVRDGKIVVSVDSLNLARR